MIDRDDVVRGLEDMLASATHTFCGGSQFMDALREAIALLCVPDSAEVDAAREWLHCLGERPENFGHKHTALKSLDALAREPGLLADRRELQHILDHMMSESNNEAWRIAALQARLVDAAALHLADERSARNMEAKLARVREVADAANAHEDYRVHNVGVAVLAAIADEATK